LAPRPLTPSILSDVRATLQNGLDATVEVASALDIALAMTGTLATVMPDHVVLANISAPMRYSLLNHVILSERHDNICIEIPREAHPQLQVSPVVAEAVNTSLMFVIETAPAEFAGLWNASSAVAAMQVSAGANAPFVFGRRLWVESRVPLFTQAADTRPPEVAA